MQATIHPPYVATTIVCACGATYPTRSTIPHLRVAVCAACHPVWTGRQKRGETAGRVAQFQQRYARHTTPTAGRAPQEGSPSRAG